MATNRYKPVQVPSSNLKSGGFGYFARRAFLNMKQNPFVSFVSVFTIALAMLIIGVFLLITVNLEGVSLKWSEKIQVTVYFQQEMDQPAINSVISAVQALPETKRVEYVSKAAALEKFRQRLKGQETLLDGVTSDVLPASLEISLKRDHRNAESVAKFVAKLQKISGIGEIQYGEEWVKRFSSFLDIVRLVGILVAIFLFVAVVFIVSNTIRLTIYARKDELEVLALVGATRMFIKAPFLIEGIIQGGIGALISLTLLGSVYLIKYSGGSSFIPQNILSGITFLTVEQVLSIFFGGIILGFLGSLTSLRRFMIF